MQFTLTINAENPVELLKLLNQGLGMAGTDSGTLFTEWTDEEGDHLADVGTWTTGEVFRATTEWDRIEEQWKPVVGESYEFVSEIEGADGNGVQLRDYTGQPATVLGRVGEDENDPENSPMYRVRFPDGTEAHAWWEEISGWDKERGQFYS